jgi:hypothetical protein
MKVYKLRKFYKFGSGAIKLQRHSCFLVKSSGIFHKRTRCKDIFNF